MLTMSLYIKRWTENGKIDTTEEKGLYQYREIEFNTDSEERFSPSHCIHCTVIYPVCNLKNYVFSLSWSISFWKFILSRCQHEFSFVESMLPHCQRQFLFVESMLPRRQRQFLFCRTAPHTLWEWFSFCRIEVHS
mgnify:CR=1 FL=1